MYNATQKHAVEVVICDINNVEDNNIFEESKRTNDIEIKEGKEFFKDFIIHKISIGPYSLMMSREFIRKINLKFNENSKYSEEFIFITDLLYNSNKVIYVKEKLYNYCLRRGSVSTGANLGKILNGYNQIEEYSKKYEDNKNCYEVLYNKYALPRWILATARFTASNLKYCDYKELMKKLKAKEKIKKLITFPELKIKLATVLFIISTPLFYLVSRKELR